MAKKPPVIFRYICPMGFEGEQDNVTPADVYFGREKEVIKKRNRLKEKTLALRRQQHLIRAGV